ncbi:MAG: DUF4878 domain-containing protein [Phycisphaeraceae bacterium]|nr:DUF4878 domain-containing protein [Phycisphaeraceae bacterium]
MSLLKLLLSVVVSVALSIALVSCGGETKAPGQVATAWYRAMLSGDGVAVKRWSRPDTSDETWSQLSQMVSAGPVKATELGELQSVEVVRTELIGGDRAKVTVRPKFGGNGQGTDGVLMMIKVDGKWYVDTEAKDGDLN